MKQDERWSPHGRIRSSSMIFALRLAKGTCVLEYIQVCVQYECLPNADILAVAQFSQRLTFAKSGLSTYDRVN